MERKKASDYPPDVLKLFDGYVHGGINRREFLDRAAKYAVGGFTAAAMLESLRPNFALAQQVPKTDSRHPRRIPAVPVAAGLRNDARILRATGERRPASCRASSSSTRIAASIRTSRMSRAGSPWRISSRSRPMR